MDQRFSFERPLPGNWGLYGGTFDPIHRGHLYAARQVAGALDLNGVIFLPSGDPPHKAGLVHTPADQRLAMVRLAIEDEPDFFYSDYELLRPGPSYSYRTAEALAAMLPPSTRLIFIIGGDSLIDMPKWRYPERILQAMPVAAAYRPGTAMPAMDAARAKLGKDRVILVPCPGLAVSSTAIRGGDLSGTPEKVAQYIRERGLYRGKWTGSNG